MKNKILILSVWVLCAAFAAQAAELLVNANKLNGIPVRKPTYVDDGKAMVYVHASSAYKSRHVAGVGAGGSGVGPAGPPGAPGTAATVAVGSTTTGAAGSHASVTNSGSSSAAVLNFTIPRGATGNTGPTGPQGVQGPQGPQGQQGVQGPQGPQGVAGGSMSWRGVYDELVQYYANDAVRYGSPASSYIAIADTLGDIPDVSPTKWSLVVSAGERGFRGYSGAQGAQGPQGFRGYSGAQGAQGPQGFRGYSGARGLTGAAGGSLKFKGAWSAFANYSALDAITYNGSSFAAKAASTNLAPWIPPAAPTAPQNTAWQLQAQKGADGAQGPQGTVGPTGPADTSHVVFSRMTSALSANEITGPGYISNAPDGTHRVNVRNSTSRTYTPAEGDMDTDADGKIWLYVSGQWIEKGAAYTLPTASDSVKGGVKIGSSSSLSVDGDGFLSVTGASGLESAILIGTQVVEMGKAYAATGAFYATFLDNSSTKQMSIATPPTFGNHSGTLCAASEKVHWVNPVTFQGYSSPCAHVPPNTRLVAQIVNGKTLATSTRNLQAVVTEPAAPPEYTEYFANNFGCGDSGTVYSCASPAAFSTETDSASSGTISSGAYVVSLAATTTGSSVTKTALTAYSDVKQSYAITFGAVTGLGSGGYTRVSEIDEASAAGIYLEVYNTGTNLAGLRVRYQRGDNTSQLSSSYPYTFSAGVPYIIALRFKASSDTSTTDGYYHVTINGVDLIPETAITTNGRAFTKVALGAIANSVTTTQTYTFDNFSMGWK